MVKTKENTGITLIALIITIVVLLILAGVTISQITGSENAMEKATEAREKNEQGAELDAIKLAVVNSVASGLDGLVDTTILKSELNGLVEEQGRLAINDSKTYWEVIGKESKIKYEINKNGNVIVKSGITLSTTKIEFEGNVTTYTLEATLSNDLKGTINWSIPENNGVASINKTEGNSVIVLKNGQSGSTIITATLNGTSYPTTCEVEILNPPQVGDNIILGDAIPGIGNETSNKDDWVILYDGRGEDDGSDLKGVFCILSDYLPNNNSVIASTGLKPVSGKIYSVNLTSQSSLVEALQPTGNNKDVWKQLVSSTLLGDYYGATKVYGALTGNGNTEVMDKIKSANKSSKYYKAKSAADYNTHSCFGYWLATARSNNIGVCTINYNGDFNAMTDYDSSQNGVCPVVILPSSVSLTKTNGVWNVN